MDDARITDAVASLTFVNFLLFSAFSWIWASDEVMVSIDNLSNFSVSVAI